MIETLLLILGLLAGILAGAGAAYVYFRRSQDSSLARRQAEATGRIETILKDAENRGKEIELAARQDVLKLREAFEAEKDEEEDRLEEAEKRLAKREDTLDHKLDVLSTKEHKLDDREAAAAEKVRQLDQQTAALDQKHAEADLLLSQHREALERAADLSPEQAKALLMERLEHELAAETAHIVQTRTEAAQRTAKEKAREILLQALQRYAAEQSADHTVTSIHLPDEAMKGRVIGKEGRNIRAFEKATGVDVIIDETPGVVGLSCFDPVRREIARLGMEKLVNDGRIHPGRIEEVVEQTRQEITEGLDEIGQKAANEAHLPDLPEPLLPLLGRLHYRTSYGQNVLKHSQEVAYLSQLIATQLGLDGELARRAGLLHDLGKALDHEHEGGHPQIGADVLRRHKECEAVVNAALAHHGDEPATTPYTPIVMAADAISASRPGARRESLERYVKRLNELEGHCTDFDGVRQAYAIHAGREVRVIVDARRIDDRATAKLARDISKRLENQLRFPGEIKVTVLREVRTVEYAR
jgi:ribonuclease Y